uniref:Uncharacterized protein n=1 Tax=Siphoviridae sp. ctxMM9 TaxID=2827973 RepID=A0A8S5T6K0_9CAUD|nr:MAG TPA: hypothetical protein [Siphoviridae sp. ctxMM9]
MKLIYINSLLIKELKLLFLTIIMQKFLIMKLHVL